MKLMKLMMDGSFHQALTDSLVSTGLDALINFEICFHIFFIYGDHDGKKNPFFTEV
jgi:hypothetical protein